MPTQAEIAAQQNSVNLINERISEIPGEIAAKQKTVLLAETESNIQTILDEIVALERELLEQRLLERRAFIKLHRMRGEREKSLLATLQTQYANVLDDLPAAQTAFENAKTALDDLNAQLHQVSGQITDRERAIEQHFNVAAQIENLQFKFPSAEKSE